MVPTVHLFQNFWPHCSTLRTFLYCTTLSSTTFSSALPSRLGLLLNGHIISPVPPLFFVWSFRVSVYTGIPTCILISIQKKWAGLCRKQGQNPWSSLCGKLDKKLYNPRGNTSRRSKNTKTPNTRLQHNTTQRWMQNRWCYNHIHGNISRVGRLLIAV